MATISDVNLAWLDKYIDKLPDGYDAVYEKLYNSPRPSKITLEGAIEQAIKELKQ